ncbi:MAG: glycosyltransferase [Bacteroidales bacterium]|nr:glycosyltransferase [Bacteroidales bacterium]
MQPGRKILIITYYWPPCGGAGVQRWLKFAKYLPEYGWEPIVLTVDPEYAEYPVIDKSLERDIRPGTRVYKTKTLNYFRLGRPVRPPLKASGAPVSKKDNLKNRIARFIRGNFFIPDPRKGWNRYAISKASELISEEDIKFVVTTSPPHSTQLIGLKLKSLFPDIKWIADLRDPWTDIYYYKQFYGSLPARIYDHSLEKKVLQRADKLITVGDSLAGLFSEKLKDPDKNISVITNGYDEEDFTSVKETSPDILTITYTGTLTEQYPVDSLISSLLRLSSEGIKYVFNYIGSCPENIKNKIIAKLPEDSCHFSSYITHRDAVDAMCKSAVLLLLIPDHKNNEIIITGKLFEYLRSRKPILIIGPENGDAAHIVRKWNAGKTFEKTDHAGITSYLRSMITNQSKYNLPVKYNRRLLTARLIEEIE